MRKHTQRLVFVSVVHFGGVSPLDVCRDVSANRVIIIGVVC